MQTITLNNGVEMPLIGLGTFGGQGEELQGAILGAIQAGYRMIDTAQMYKNEAQVGAAIKESAVPRRELFLATKIYDISRSFQKAKEAIDRSLVDLQTDYIDLLMLHMPYEESLEMYAAMEQAYQEGKVRAIGVCNFREERYLDLIGHCTVIPAVNQFETHIFQQNEELQRVLLEHGTHLTAWSPLAKGQALFENEVLQQIAQHHHRTVVVLRNLVQRGIPVIPKSVHQNRIEENMQIFDFQLDASEMEQIAQLDQNRSILEWTQNL